MLQIDLGLKIQALRKQLGISQEKFALQISMDRTYFASIESGKRNVSLINLEKIANGLGITLSELFLDLHSGKEGDKK